jgi:cyanuric acid amidohydrolase
MTQVQDVSVHRVAMAGPADTSGVLALIDGGQVRAEDVVAIVCKTEGNGCVNDFTRGYTTLAFSVALAEPLGMSPDHVRERIALVMSGGTEGVMSPHATVFARRRVEAAPGEEKKLAVGVAFTRAFQPEEIGRRAMVMETAARVRAAMADAGIDDVADVHLVQIKCPLLTAERVEDAVRRGQSVATEDTYHSMGYCRGAASLGVAVALGEVPESAVRDESVLRDWDLYSTVASTSAGIELRHVEIVVMGNSRASASRFVIGHSVMRDAIDGRGVREALRAAGVRLEDGAVAEADADRVVNVLAKAEADPTGRVRGRRHTMLDDSDINSTRHARGAVAGVIASIVGDPMVYVSGGSEHQGPAGGGPVAVIARREIQER